MYFAGGGGTYTGSGGSGGSGISTTGGVYGTGKTATPLLIVPL